MPCFRPIDAWMPALGGPVSFYPVKDSRQIQLPCRVCIGCYLARARNWAIRCIHEARFHEVSSFVTLTYDEDHIPYDFGLRYRDFQLFMKRLRQYGKVRYFVAGEYGSRFKRPHFHALLFGFRPSDAKEAGKDLYSSECLDYLWQNGSTRFGSVTYDSAGYCAKYCLKASGNFNNTERYRRVDPESGEIFVVEPEFAHMSLKPGLGYEWFVKFWRDVYLARDGVVMEGGYTLPSPSYYDRLLEATMPFLREEKSLDRYLRSLQFKEDCSPQRLLAREIVAKANQRVRSLD